jgi:hypothetical protein
MISVANAPGNDEITGEQTLVFKAVLPHVDRAVRIHPLPQSLPSRNAMSGVTAARSARTA